MNEKALSQGGEGCAHPLHSPSRSIPVINNLLTSDTQSLQENLNP